MKKTIVFNDRGLSGLNNIANTCYINTCCHLLSATLPLSYYFLSDMYLDNTKNEYDNLLLTEWVNLLKEIWSENQVITPHPFYKSLLHRVIKIDKCLERFMPNTHQDLNEFFVFFLDYIHEALSKEVEIIVNGEVKNTRDKIALDAIKYWKTSFEKQYSIIIELFYGQFISITSCPECSYFYNNYEPFNNINLPIPGNIETPTIYHCLDLLTENEILDIDNKWKCDKCQVYQKAQKKILFWKTPNILVIFFNRFRDNKLSVLIDFPIYNLDIGKYCFNYSNEKHLYNLYGIGNYFGNGMGGHYTSIIKNKNSKWYHIDDNTINELDENTVINNRKYAYCLFYQKIT